MSICKRKPEVLMHQFIKGFYSGGLGRVLEMIHSDIVWIWNGYKTFVVGAERVCRSIPAKDDGSCMVSDEEYIVVYEGEKCCVIAGRFLVGGKALRCDHGSLLYHVTAFWTDLDTRPLLKHIHLSQIGNRFLIQDAAGKEKTGGDICYEVKDRENNTYFLKDADIIYIESRKNYLIWHCRKYELTIRGTMSHFQEQMSAAFLRIHKSYLININYVEKINRCCLKMRNGDEIQIPVKRYRQVRDLILERPGIRGAGLLDSPEEGKFQHTE